MFGWIIPEPLHIPPIVTVLPPISTSTATSFYRIRCHDRFCCQCCCFSGIQKQSGKILHAFLIVSIGSCFPITPVDATRTSSLSIPSASAAAFAVSLHSSHILLLRCRRLQYRCLPQQLSPLHVRIPHADPILPVRLFTRFVVNVPAAIHGALLTIIAISFCTFFDTCMHTGCFKSLLQRLHLHLLSSSMLTTFLCFMGTLVRPEGLRSRQIQTSGSYSARPDRLHLSPDCPLPPS